MGSYILALNLVINEASMEYNHSIFRKFYSRHIKFANFDDMTKFREENRITGNCYTAPGCADDYKRQEGLNMGGPCNVYDFYRDLNFGEDDGDSPIMFIDVIDLGADK